MGTLGAAACTPTTDRPAEPTDAPDNATTATTTPTAASRDPDIPPDSGDYSAALKDAKLYKSGAISFDELKSRVLARNLPPHPLGCSYLMTPVPAPPPGVPFDARMMPRDWERNWGEVAMTFWVGTITREEHDRLHAAAHPNEPKP